MPTTLVSSIALASCPQASLVASRYSMCQPYPRAGNQSALNLENPLRICLDPQRIVQQAMAVLALTAMPCRPMIKFA